MAIAKLFVANRGEIAVRIIRAARELGIATVQAVSAADRDMLAARLADEVVEIGPAHARKSYLDMDAVLRGAIESGADAIHPGYGFLSENAAFAEKVEAAGLVFVGPKAETIRAMGDKATARAMASAAGVPCVPGSEGRVEGVAEAERVAKAIGYPVMIKASAGGGGRGIRVAESPSELEKLIPQASAEALAAFGDGGLYLERFVAHARHVEVQILGDGTRAIHVFERECSLQRRRQKVWEEAPAACLSPETRVALCASAVRLAESVGYRGAGTLEYLYDGRTGEFFFIEMNTRIQVEHPVSEMITGIDLVREMIRVAGGAPLAYAQDDVVAKGHAIEVRINAEDPAKGFLPGPGTVTALTVPGGMGVRFDGMLYPGYQVPPFYDSLLGKLIVWDETRDGAIDRLARALAELKVEGLPTTTALHAALARDADVRAGAVHTRWLEGWLDAHPLGSPQ
ncbi:acetyl-CoA carboxylase biotin carboxylase subunit [Oharaeibacter diazotrophicus]|uniref:biotin carboxylase n=1 Tax=Oharaeibacter diazotrophicus TaxID=1920512 RepID=A0A4R6RJW2_9HYPH|nr:acetyl-CoA carboxylase biotin carboxylase subunit [Oharaeibacter diazotrophicus]TDP86931.1 acetyl-CoA carboxylase biotin carboxylase subunit [Oharaeibacter diazotrophicus]BBE71126.1 biotin carboxylase [Pleomorphomonas sp. SM30]GLS77880.1 acetyl-CoA carboxylase biotin carboxylase subunit [Oharaeibacter diazotrophicus]